MITAEPRTQTWIGEQRKQKLQKMRDIEKGNSGVELKQNALHAKIFSGL